MHASGICYRRPETKATKIGPGDSVAARSSPTPSDNPDFYGKISSWERSYPDVWRKIRRTLGLDPYPLKHRALVLWRSVDLLAHDRILWKQVPEHFRGVSASITEEGRERIFEELKPYFPYAVKLWISRFLKRRAARDRFIAEFRRAIAPEPSPFFMTRDIEYGAADAGSVIYKVIGNVRNALEVESNSPMIYREIADYIVLTVREEMFEAMKLAFGDPLPDMAYFDRQKAAYSRRSGVAAPIDTSRGNS
jgi:hypothetical protein